MALLTSGTSGILSTTWAGKPVSYPVGQPVFITNAGTKGSHWYWDGTRWKPVGGAAMLASMDSASASIGNSGTIVFQYQMPTGLFQTSDRLRLYVGMTKSGTTDTSGMQVYVGTAGTTSDTAVLAVTSMNATTLQTASIMDFRLESATSIRMMPNTRLQAGYGASSTTAWDAAVTISSASANSLWFSFVIYSNGTTNTVRAVDAQLQLVAKGG